MVIMAAKSLSSPSPTPPLPSSDRVGAAGSWEEGAGGPHPQLLSRAAGEG